MYFYSAVISEVAKTTVCKLDLLGGVLLNVTVLDHGLNLDFMWC